MRCDTTFAALVESSLSRSFNRVLRASVCLDDAGTVRFRPISCTPLRAADNVVEEALRVVPSLRLKALRVQVVSLLRTCRVATLWDVRKDAMRFIFTDEVKTAVQATLQDRV